MDRLLTDEEMERISGIFRYDKPSFRAITKAQDAKTHRIDVEWLEHHICATYYSAEAGCQMVAIRQKDWQAFKGGNLK